MNHRPATLLAYALLALLALGGCATPPPPAATRAPVAAGAPTAAPTPAVTATPASTPTGAGHATAGVEGADRAAAARQQAIAAEVQRRSVAPAEVEVLAMEPHQWQDTALGCPQPGQMYAQVISPGYVVTVRTRGETTRYHADGHQAVRCG